VSTTATVTPAQIADLPLFPLGTVVFPGGLLPLRIFEARYLDLMTDCLRSGASFGVVTLGQGDEVRRSGAKVTFSQQGCLVSLIDFDSPQAGLLQVSCLGGARFEFGGQPREDNNGLWRVDANLLPDDSTEPPPADCADAVEALRLACTNLAAQERLPFREPLVFDDAGWVANRWCEILPIPAPTKLKLMLLPDAAARLRLVADFLRRKGIVTA
jgi:hypothetical protein